MSDLIRREDVIDELMALRDAHKADQFAGDLLHWTGIKAMLESIPSAEPERRKGEWIKSENPNLGPCLRVVYQCSVCHKGVGCEYFVRRSFCPNCGADMRGAE